MDIIQQLQRDEGFRSSIYIDTVGKRTIGYGHNLDANPISWIDSSTILTTAQATAILIGDIARISQQLFLHLPWAGGLDDARCGVLINMAFNLGVGGLLSFHNTLAAVEQGDWITAGQRMTNSVWFTQVGARANRLVIQMETGIWQ